MNIDKIYALGTRKFGDIDITPYITSRLNYYACKYDNPDIIYNEEKLQYYAGFFAAKKIIRGFKKKEEDFYRGVVEHPDPQWAAENSSMMVASLALNKGRLDILKLIDDPTFHICGFLILLKKNKASIEFYDFFIKKFGAEFLIEKFEKIIESDEEYKNMLRMDYLYEKLVKN